MTAQRLDPLPKAPRMRRHSIGLHSVPKKALFSAIVVSVVATGALCAVAVPSEIEGRWKATDKELVLDINRCGTLYCGRLVKAENQCDKTVLTVQLKSTSGENVYFEGKLDLPGKRGIYQVQVSVFPRTQEEAKSLSIVGDDATVFNIMRRSYPFHARLTRLGEARCRPPVTN